LVKGHVAWTAKAPPGSHKPLAFPHAGGVALFYDVRSVGEGGSGPVPVLGSRNTSQAVAGTATRENADDFMQIHKIEMIFHEAGTTKNLDLMLSLFADDATLTS
jgi:hypothetical protein